MELSVVEQLLIYGLAQFNLEEDLEQAIFVMMKTDDMKEAMINWLASHLEATEEEIKAQAGKIIRKSKGML